MKIISFSWTTPALLAGEKTVTRRDWAERHAMTFHTGDLVQAWDKVPFAGGKKVAIIRLTQAPYLADINEAPDSDYGAEGFGYMEGHGIEMPSGVVPNYLDDRGRELKSGPMNWDRWEFWKATRARLWVVRFKLESVEGAT